MSDRRTWQRRVSLIRGWAMLALPLLLLLIGLAVSPVLAQEGDNQAGLVVVHSDGRVLTRCVGFPEEQITGLTLLQRAGLSFVSAPGPQGVAICALDGEGCPATDCFCACKGTPCMYWTYFLGSPGGGWIYANVGASMRQVHDGDVDAWVLGNGQQVPPLLSFETICAGASLAPATTQAAAGPTVTPPSPTSMPTATASPTPTSSPVLPPTSTPTPSPVSTVKPPTPRPTGIASLTPSPTVRVAETQTALPLPSEQYPTAQLTPDVSPSASRSAGANPAYLSFAGALALLGGVWLIVRSRGDRR